MNYFHTAGIVLIVLLILAILLLILAIKYKSLIFLFLFLVVLYVVYPTFAYICRLGCYMVPYVNKTHKYKEFKEDFSLTLDKTFNYNITGNIPKLDTPVIYTYNHLCKMDMITDIFSLFKIQGNNCIVISNVINPIYNKMLTNVNYINLDHENRTDNFIKDCESKIKDGFNIVLYPEGKYSKKKDWRSPIKFQTGAFILSKKTNIPIVPVVISGGNMAMGIVIKKKITIKYLDPVYPENFDTPELMRDYVFKLTKNTLVNI